MIQEDEHIIYISQAKCAVTIKEPETMKTGMMQKKIVVTTRRCLFFESLSNLVLEMEYEVMTKKKKADEQKNKEKQKKQKKRISINEFPEHSFPINDRECKIMIDEQPSCHKYLQKIGLRNFIKSITGIVILKNLPKMRFQLLAFPALKDGFRFCKAVVCSKAWMVYQRYCAQNKVTPNKMFARILCDIANNESSITIIDPDLFLTGSRQQIKSFLILINQIPFAHSYQHRYSITSPQICEYSQNFLQMFQQKTHSLIFQHNNLTTLYMNSIFTSQVKLEHLMHIDLSYNKLTDQVFVNFTRFTKECKRLSKFVLAHNAVTMNNGTLFINFLKSTQIMLTIDLSYNLIQDACLDIIQKFVIMPQNPPVDELNISFNKLSKKTAWRLFVGNQRYHKYHTYLNFIVYPIPLCPDTFPEQNIIDYPKPSPLINFNIHEALVQQFQQQSIMKHTLNQILAPKSEIIRLLRRLPKDLKLPRTKEEVNKATQMANRIQNFIYSPQFVQNMYDMAEEITNFQFNIPPVSRSRFIKYLSDKLNEALFIRDHYSVKFILKAFRIMKVDYEGYQPRINKLMTRDDIINKKVQQIVNFDVDEIGINQELDEIVREGLRLYLAGNGIQTIYYLKYLRDKWIQRLIQQKYNPQHFIHQKMADKNMNLDDQVTQKELVIPYEIRVEKKINQNFYLHPWKTNYLVLSQILKVQYEECLQFLQQSSKKQKFAIYFQRIQERIEFMKNQFTLFNYNKFKCTYNDLKINCCRLLSMYRFITEKNYFLEIPSIARKVQVTKEKIVTVLNQERFKKDYHIKFYPNINTKARRANFYNYTNRMTKYGSEMLNQQFLRLKNLMDAIFRILDKEAMVNSNRIPQEIMGKLIQIIKYIRQAIYPQELKQEFYLRVLSWRSGKHSNNRWILMYLPFLTMYLLPPLALQKYIIAQILNNENLNIGELPLNIISDINKPTDINIQQLQKNFVERDWMASQKVLVELMRNNGKTHMNVQLLVKKQIELKPRQSNTVGQVVSALMSQVKDIQDISHFWLYMGYIGDTNSLIVLEESQHVGQILCQKEELQKFFLFKRRIYCPEWKFIYKKYSQSVINNLFYDIRYEYLLGQFFINDKQLINLAASLIIIDTVQQIPMGSKTSFQDLISVKLKNLGSIYKGYMPGKAINRYGRNTAQMLANLKDKINEKVMKKEYLKTLQTKKQILTQFEEYPQFLCSNYIFLDRNKKIIKVSINYLQVYVNSQLEIETIGLEKIISVVPKAKFLLINYHKTEGITGKVSLFGDQNKILATAQDLLAYCMIRIRMLSPSLYSAFRLQFLMTKHIRIKEPTKQKQILDQIRRIKKKLESANPTIIEQDLIPYFAHNRYIKVFINRKLYANASLEKLQIMEGQEEEEDNQVFDIKRKKGAFDDSRDYGGHNVFKTVFPKANGGKYEDQEDFDQFQMSGIGRSFSEMPSQSYINNTSNQKPEPTQQKPNLDLTERDYDDEPPQLTPIKPVPNQQEFEPITTAQKTRNRLPPRKNR